MAVTQGSTYANVETECYIHLTQKIGFNTAIACGILANIQRESNFNPHIVNSIGAYGLFQYLGGRKSNLLSRSSRPSVAQQLDFMKYELNNSERATMTSIKDLPNTAQGAYEAARLFSKNFERHGISQEDIDRGILARDKYFPHYSNGANVPNNSIEDLGKKIVEIARAAVKDKKQYIPGGNMYNNNNKGADGPGFIYYCYRKAGISIEEKTATQYYNTYKSTATKITSQNVAAGDLLFYISNGPEGIGDLSHVAIANGEGGRIHAAGITYGGIIEEEGIGNPTAILRILSDSQITQNYTATYVEIGIDPEEYADITSTDPYNPALTLSKVVASKEGLKYGYLIDMTHGGEFKFYIPEFNERAGAQWSDIDIRGRSVKIKAYESTNSRGITISLDLYAGEGLYKAQTGESGEGTVSRLHKDAFFVKSLEYPDYSNTITRPPSVVHLILGSTIDIVGVVSDVSIDHLKPLDAQNRAMYLKMSFTVTQTATNPPDYRDIRNGNYAVVSTEDIGTINQDSNTNAPVYSN